MKHSDNKTLIHKAFNYLGQPQAWIWIFAVLLLVPNILLDFTERYTIAAKITNILLPAGVYLLLLSASRRTGRMIYCALPFAILAAFQIVLIFLYGESIIAIDMFLNVATTNVSEATELLGNMGLAIAVILILYLPSLIMGAIFWTRHKKAREQDVKAARRTGLCFLAAGAIMLIACIIWVPGYKAGRQLFPYNVICNIATASERFAQARDYHDTSKDFTYHASSTRDSAQREIYVLVVGETSRADNWQLMGYDRPTNPRLSKREGVVPFTRAMSEINTTHKSVPMLLSWLDSETFGDSINTTRSIFEAFKTSGYHTVYISNQGRNHSYIDFFGEEADETAFLTDNVGIRPDFDILEPLQRVIADTTATKTFVVVHTYGSHFNYGKRYPRDMAYFTPDTETGAERNNRRDLINAYDNSQRYTDALIDSIIGMLNERNTVSALLYASDHGEDIFDDERERFLHASPVPTYWQLHVAMLAWTSPEYARAFPKKVDWLSRHKHDQVSSTRSFFNTMLDLAGIATPYLKESESLASGNYKAPRRMYLNDYNEAVSYDECGFYPEDFVQLKHHGITAK